MGRRLLPSSQDPTVAGFGGVAAEEAAAAAVAAEAAAAARCGDLLLLKMSITTL